MRFGVTFITKLMSKLEELFLEMSKLKNNDEKVKLINELRDEVDSLRTFIFDA